jgi:hypothetical protein
MSDDETTNADKRSEGPPSPSSAVLSLLGVYAIARWLQVRATKQGSYDYNLMTITPASPTTSCKANTDMFISSSSKHLTLYLDSRLWVLIFVPVFVWWYRPGNIGIAVVARG